MSESLASAAADSAKAWVAVEPSVKAWVAVEPSVKT